jgi:hypothetical protein
LNALAIFLNQKIDVVLGFIGHLKSPSSQLVENIAHLFGAQVRVESQGDRNISMSPAGGAVENPTLAIALDIDGALDAECADGGGVAEQESGVNHSGRLP